MECCRYRSSSESTHSVADYAILYRYARVKAEPLTGRAWTLEVTGMNHAMNIIKGIALAIGVPIEEENITV